MPYELIGWISFQLLFLFWNISAVDALVIAPLADAHAVLMAFHVQMPVCVVTSVKTKEMPNLLMILTLTKITEVQCSNVMYSKYILCPNTSIKVL